MTQRGGDRMTFFFDLKLKLTGLVFLSIIIVANINFLTVQECCMIINAQV